MFFIGFWALGPLMAWLSGHPFGQGAAILMLAVGYNLSFIQLGRTPKQALVVTSPYTALAAYFADPKTKLDPEEYKRLSALIREAKERGD
jgi:hypothetical protein